MFLGLAFGAVAPIVGFLAGWWLSVPVAPERLVFVVGLVGLVAGLAIDVPMRRWWVRHGYDAPGLVLVGLCGFYAAGAFGLFMGMPVPILAVGVTAGVFAARGRLDVRAAARVTTAWAALACVASAAFALASPSTPADLEGMLALPFTVTWSMVVALICVGGVVLVAAQYWLTTASARWWWRQEGRREGRRSHSPSHGKARSPRRPRAAHRRPARAHRRQPAARIGRSSPIG